MQNIWLRSVTFMISQSMTYSTEQCETEKSHMAVCQWWQWEVLILKSQKINKFTCYIILQRWMWRILCTVLHSACSRQWVEVGFWPRKFPTDGQGSVEAGERQDLQARTEGQQRIQVSTNTTVITKAAVKLENKRGLILQDKISWFSLFCISWFKYCNWTPS
jgi:hypothetical protein